MANVLRVFIGVAVVFVASFAGERTALSDDEATAPAAIGPQLPRVKVVAVGPDDAVLEERIGAFEKPEWGWRQLCGMPCHTTATVDPYAEHRVVDGHKMRPVSITGSDGERVVVSYERPPLAARLLFGGGILTSALGGSFALAGLLALSGYGETAANAEQHQMLGRTFVTAGGVAVLVGGVAIVLGALHHKPSAHVSRPGLAVSF